MAASVCVGDLEDIAAPSQMERPPRGVRLRAPTAAAGRPASAAVPSADGASPAPPGSQSVYVKTYGCSHNASDSEYMCGLLAAYGYALLPEAHRAEADVWLINSCTVKNPSQDHLATDLRRGRALGKALVVAGCVPQADSALARPGGILDGVSVLGVQQFDKIVEVVRHALDGHTVSRENTEESHRASPQLDPDS